MEQDELKNLISNESFLSYCFRRNPVDVDYWEQWLAANPSHRSEVEKIKEAIFLLNSQIGKLEAENEYVKFTRMFAQPKKMPLLYRLIKYSVAAILLLAATIAVYTFKNQRQTKHIAKVISNDVAPGKDAAILTLADGTKIDLSKVGNGLVAAQSGIKITKTAQGQLVYDLSGAAAQSVGGSNTITVPVGGQWQLILPDQTKVWLNAQSSITYPIRFIGNERLVKITGEAYLEVAHNKAMPFKVSCSGQRIEVLGTHFNVSAYADDKIVKTTLLQGAIRISTKNQTKLLKPNQQAVFNQSNLDITNNVDLEEVLAWKNGDFKFDDNLENIMTKIARWYDVDVIYQIKPDPNLSFSGQISRSRNISGVLKMLAYNGDVHFKIEGRRVIVTK